jgi:hypothetical protein
LFARSNASFGVRNVITLNTGPKISSDARDARQKLQSRLLHLPKLLVHKLASNSIRLPGFLEITLRRGSICAVTEAVQKDECRNPHVRGVMPVISSNPPFATEAAFPVTGERVG